MKMQAGRSRILSRTIVRAFSCAAGQTFAPATLLAFSRAAGWRFAIAALTIGVLLGAAPAWPAPAPSTQRIYLDDDAAQDPAAPLVKMTVAEPAAGATRLAFELAGFDLEPVTIDGRPYHRVALDREAALLERGAPDLPHLCRSVIVPDDARMEVRVVSSSYRDFPEIDIAPSKGALLRSEDPEAVPFMFGEAYTTDAWYPSALITPREPYIFRDQRGLVIDVNPLQYNPATRTLRVYERVVVEAVPAGTDQVNVLVRTDPARKQPHSFVDMYEEHFVNFVPPLVTDQVIGEMLVLVPDEFVSAMHDFVAWKNQMGLRTTLIPKTVAGTTATEIATFIANFYATHDLTFVLLVGDAAQMPPMVEAWSAADPVYALLAGEDDYPDVFVGRLSAETPEAVLLQARKFVEYERDAQAGASWYHKGTGIGSSQGAGEGDDGEADYQHIENIRTDLLGFTYTQVDTLYPVSPYRATAQMVIDAVNAGRSIINYCGHGSATAWMTTGFSTTSIAELTNYDRLPWIISVACLNGLFNTTTCFAESWLRANQAGEPTGAVGMYASNIMMTWVAPMAAQDEAVDLLVARREATLGGLCYLGACLMMDEYPDANEGPREFKHWHLFGDPSLEVRSDTPAPLAVRHVRRLDPGATSLDVQVDGVAGALCGLSRQGDYLASAYTDSNGQARLLVAEPLPEGSEVTLTVTAFNALPHIARIQVREKRPPVVDVSPSSLSFAVAPGGTEVARLQIAQRPAEGEEPDGTVVGYRVSAWDATGLDCAWVEVQPARGECAEGETDVLQVTLDAGGLLPGDYRAGLVVDTGTASVVVPVRLRVDGTMAIGDEEASGELPRVLALSAPCPSPAARSSRVDFALPSAQRIELAIYDAAGRRVRTLLSGNQPAGMHAVAWDGRDDYGRLAPSGVYLYRLVTPEGVLTRRAVILR